MCVVLTLLFSLGLGYDRLVKSVILGASFSIGCLPLLRGHIFLSQVFRRSTAFSAEELFDSVK